MPLDEGQLMECYAAALLADWGFTTNMRVDLPGAGGVNATDTDALGTVLRNDGVTHVVFSVTTESTAPYHKLLTAMGVAYYLERRMEHENMPVRAHVVFAHRGRPGLNYPIDHVTIQTEATVVGEWPDLKPTLEALSPYAHGVSGHGDGYRRAFLGLMYALESPPAADRRAGNLCALHRRDLEQAVACPECRETGFLSRVIAGNLQRKLFGTALWLAPAERDEELIKAHFLEQRLFQAVASEVGAAFSFQGVSTHPEAVHAGTLQTLSRLQIIAGACEAAVKRSRHDGRIAIDLGGDVFHFAEGRTNYESTVDWLVEHLDVACAAPRILQHFTCIYGGFFLDAQEEQEIERIALETESTPEIVRDSIGLFDKIFPFERGWMQALSNVPIRYLILTPLWLRGLGVQTRESRGTAMELGTYQRWLAETRNYYAWALELHPDVQEDIDG